jgi:predicted amidohydrolase YtcJ
VLIRGAEIEGRAPLDVRIRSGRIAEIAPTLEREGSEPLVEAGGGALLPGLHDHHIHLLALAAARSSAHCGPESARDAEALARVLDSAPEHQGWIRGIGYHESVAGPLDRWRLDAWQPERPVRIQHRTGSLWILNSAAIRRLGLEAWDTPPGVERDAAGRPTGRLFRLDTWLRDGMAEVWTPSLADTGRELAASGVTGATDATATNERSSLGLLTEAAESRALPQRLLVMGSPDLPPVESLRVDRGAVKLVLDDAQLPDPDDLAASIVRAHASGRGTAIHCVTRAELLVATVALAAAGSRPSDRIEHAGVAPPELLGRVKTLGVAVITQPHFLSERGDAYAAEVDPCDRPWLYRGRGWLDAGVPLAGGSDAPFGDADPWQAMRAAVLRRSLGGVSFAPDEALTPEEALGLFTGRPEAPGRGARRVVVGEPADLCLLDRSWRRMREELTRDAVSATWVDGELLWRRPEL